MIYNNVNSSVIGTTKIFYLFLDSFRRVYCDPMRGPPDSPAASHLDARAFWFSKPLCDFGQGLLSPYFEDFRRERPGLPNTCHYWEIAPCLPVKCVLGRVRWNKTIRLKNQSNTTSEYFVIFLTAAGSLNAFSVGKLTLIPNIGYVKN